MFHCKFLIIITIAPARLSWMSSSPGPALVTASCSSLLRMMSMLMVAGLMLSGKHLNTPAVSSPTWHQITLIYLNGWLKRKRRRVNWFKGFPHILQFSTCPCRPLCVRRSHYVLLRTAQLCKQHSLQFIFMNTPLYQSSIQVTTEFDKHRLLHCKQAKQTCRIVVHYSLV